MAVAQAPVELLPAVGLLIGEQHTMITADLSDETQCIPRHTYSDIGMRAHTATRTRQ